MTGRWRHFSFSGHTSTSGRLVLKVPHWGADGGNGYAVGVTQHEETPTRSYFDSDTAWRLLIAILDDLSDYDDRYALPLGVANAIERVTTRTY